MNINDAFPSKYVKASDLQNMAHLVEIAGCQMEEIGDDNRPVLYLVGKPKGVVLNKTRGSVLSDAFGPETMGWVGQKIEIYPDTTMYKGAVTPCCSLRVPLQPNPSQGGGEFDQSPQPSTSQDPGPSDEPPGFFGDSAGGDGIPF